MARQTFRFNLSSSEFPFLSSFYGRSIVYPQQDMHYVRPNAFTGSEADHNIGIPQMIFCENVLPMATGYQSINYSFVYQSNQGANVVDFDNAFYLRDASENRTLFVPGIVGTAMKRYTYDPAANTWNSSAVVLSTGDVSVSVANLKGRTFIHAEFNANFYEWTGVWNVVAIPALVGTNIRGLTSANAYLIAWDYDTIYWSSTTNPVDFVPSLATGAGSEKLLSRKGRIVSCKSIEDGFIIYCEVNTLIAKYSGNIRFPWNIKEIKNSGGISSPTVAANGGDGLNIYVYSTNGLMANGPNTATLNFATVNEFLGFRRIESWNPVTKNIDVVDLTDTPRVKLDFIANRWLVISYGQTELTHALVYDSSLKRWGKLRITHTDCFEFFGNPGTPNSTIALLWNQIPGLWVQQTGAWSDYGSVIHGGAGSLTVPYRSLGFLQKDGTIKVVNFDLSGINDNAVMMIGRVQFLRDRLVTLQEIDAESVGNESQTKLSVWTSFDGLNVTAKNKVYPYKVKSSGNAQKWKMFLTGLNHTLVFEGNFDMFTVIARTTLDGKR
jgi:hypothetical protein